LLAARLLVIGLLLLRRRRRLVKPGRQSRYAVAKATGTPTRVGHDYLP